MKKLLFSLFAIMAFVACADNNPDSNPDDIGGGNNGNEIPNNQIWYTSFGEDVVEPYRTDVFGANIVSNVYDYENDKGVITFDDDVTSIGEKAFFECDDFESITIPNSVTSIGESAFQYCGGLNSITIPDSVTSIEDWAFHSCGISGSITIPDNVISIGEGAFSSCMWLESFYGKFASADNRCLIIDGVLKSFAPYGLATYTIPDSVTSIEDRAFQSCLSLTNITIPNSVTSIGVEAFYCCERLTSITIPDSVTSIEEYAFLGCDGLTSVYCKATTPPTLGYSEVFGFIEDIDCKFYVPRASVSAYKSAEVWSYYAKFIVGYDF